MLKRAAGNLFSIEKKLSKKGNEYYRVTLTNPKEDERGLDFINVNLFGRDVDPLLEDIGKVPYKFRDDGVRVAIPRDDWVLLFTLEESENEWQGKLYKNYACGVRGTRYSGIFPAEMIDFRGVLDPKESRAEPARIDPSEHKAEVKEEVSVDDVPF